MGDEMSKRIPIAQAEAIETATRVLRIKMEMGALKLLDSLIDDMPENDPRFGEAKARILLAHWKHKGTAL